MNDALLAPVPAAANVLANWPEVLKLVTSRSTDIRIADQEIARAEALRRQALSQALPNVTGRASVEHNFLRSDQTQTNVVRDFDTFHAIKDANGSYVTEKTTIEVPKTVASIGVTVAQPILAVQVWSSIKTASFGIDAARYQADDRRRVILAAVADAIVSVVTTERVSEINRVGLKSALERLELTQRRFRLGSGTRLDVVRAEQDVTLARSQLVSGDASVLQAREALGAALGSSQAYGVQPSISINEIEQTMRGTCSPGTPDQRADVLAARTQVQIAERKITDTRYGYLPTAQVSSTLSYSSEAIGGDHVSWSIQGVLSIPIWDGGEREAEIKLAKVNADQSKERLEAATRSAELDVTQSMRAVAVAEQARALSEQARDLARETAKLSQIAFEVGSGTSFDLVDSGRRQREAELDLAVREFELIKAKLSALLATASCKY